MKLTWSRLSPLEQLKSGEVAYLLNGSTSEGELAWYQKLGTDAYPVLTAAEGNTVYNGSFRYCDNTAASYSNSTSEDVLVHQMSATLASPKHDADEHIYHMGCRNEKCAAHKYVADKAGKHRGNKGCKQQVCGYRRPDTRRRRGLQGL